MSYFSEQLKRVLKDNSFNQVTLAETAKISQGQFSKYLRGGMPERESLTKLCEAMPQERAQLVMAYLRDLTPECARDLIMISTRDEQSSESARVREAAPDEIPLAPDVREALRYFERQAGHDPDIASWLVATYKIARA